MRVIIRACASLISVKTSAGISFSPAAFAASSRRLPATTMPVTPLRSAIAASSAHTAIGWMMPTLLTDWMSSTISG